MFKVQYAERFAEFCHRGQTRKYTGDPYINHPKRVADMVAATIPVGPDASLAEDAMCIALLHDVVEDCGIGLPELEARFGEYVAEGVDLLTDRTKETHPKLNRAARKGIYIAQLQEGPKDIQTIKLADRLDNLREMDFSDVGFLRLYVGESQDLVKALRGDFYLDRALRQTIARYTKYLGQCQ